MKKLISALALTVAAVLLSACWLPMWAQTHRSAIGSAEVRLAGSSVGFLPAMQGRTYASAEGDQITIFRPEGTGRVAALSLEWLAVASSAKFEVYAGAAVSGVPLFESKGSNGTASWKYFQGLPDTDGGALTVLFNANGANFSPKKDGRAGWKAVALGVNASSPAVAAWQLADEQPSKILLRMENDSIFASRLLVAGSKGALQQLVLALSEEKVKVQDVKLVTPTKTVAGSVNGRIITFDIQPALELPMGWHELSLLLTLQSADEGIDELSIFPVAIKMDDRQLSERIFPKSADYALDHATLPQIVLNKHYNEQARCKVDLHYQFVPMLDEKGKYNTGSEDLAVILEPADGKVVRIDFSEFELNGNAQMRVFYGADTSSLCAVFSKDEASEAVMSPLFGRRDLGEGKLLVKFNPKGSNSSFYSKKNGWRAKVASVEAVPWRLVKVATSLWKEQNTLQLYPNKQAPVYRVNLTTEGSEGEKKLQSLKFKGDNLQSLAKIELYSKFQTKLNGTVDLSKSTKIAESSDFAAGSFVLDFGSAPLTLGTRGAELTVLAIANAPENNLAGKIPLYVESYTLEGAPDEVQVDDPGRSLPKVWETKKALYMKNGEASIDSPIEFYDDGGPSGNPTVAFEGTLVLRPAVAQGRVLLEFKQFSLVANTWAPEKCDQMEVFSGSGADKKSLWKFNPSEGAPKGFAVVSEADDGTLSVYFKSPAATLAGFVAEARVVKNEPIVARKLTRESWTEAAGRRPLRAGLPGSLLLLNLEGEGAQPGVAVKAFKFHVEGVSLAVAQLLAYDLATAKTAKQLGSVEVQGNDVELPLADPYTLKFGKNLFALEGIAAVSSETGAIAAISHVCAVLSDGSELQLTPSDAVIEAQVKNIYELEHESYAPRTLTVGAAWVVKQEGLSYVYNNKGGTLTLKPAAKGSLVALELRDKFDLSSSPRHPNTRFAIFSGTDTADVSKALLDITTQQKSLPAVTKFYPKDGDTELTILFNNSGNNQGIGFFAHAWQEKETAMALGEVTAVQVDDYLEQNGKPEAFVRIALPVAGNRKPLTLEKVSVKITQGQGQVKALSLFTGSAFDAESNNLLADKQQPQAVEELQLASPLELKPGDNFLWVALTLNDDAPKGTIFDVAVESITLSGSSHALGAAGDPAGARQIGNFYLFKGDDNVEVNGSLVFYDNGGPTGPFTVKAKGTVTFTTTPGSVLLLDVHYLETNYSAKVKIETAAGKTYLESNGNKLPATIMAGESIKVTFNPKSNSTNAKGWEMVIRSIPADAPYVVTSAAVTPLQRKHVVQGETNVPMLHLALSVEGLAGECKMEKLAVSLQDANVAALVGKVKVWAAGTSSRFVDANLLAEVNVDAPLVHVPLAYPMARFDVFNFWVTIDVAPNAKPGSEIAVQLAGIQAGKYTSLPADNPKGHSTVLGGISGVYTVGGTSPDYATLTEAIAALAQGVNGPVTFLLRDGTYAENVIIPFVPGASASNTITIKSESGNRDNVVITCEKTGKDIGIVALAGISHVTLEALTVKSVSKYVHAAVSISKGSSFVTVRNCHLELPTPTSHKWDEGGDVLYTQSDTKSNTLPINSTLVEGCKIVGGKNGIALNGGQGNISYPTGKGIIVRNNTIVSGMLKAIWITDVTDFCVENNRVEASNLQFGYDYHGFDGRRLFGPGRIANNVISLDNRGGVATLSLYGIKLRNDYLEGTAEAPIVVVNNQITIDNVAKAGSNGIELGDSKGTGKHVIVAHNTIVFGEDVSSGSALMMGSKGEGVKVQNNLFINMAKAGNALRVLGKNALEGIALSKNAFWSPSESSPVKIGEDSKQLAELASIPALANSIVERPFLTDFPADLSLLNGSSFQVNAQDSVAGIGAGRDAVGEKRGERPTVGALESAPRQLAWFPAEPTPSQIYEDAVEVQVALSMPGECRFAVRRKGEAAPSAAEWKDLLPVQLKAKREVTLAEANLEPGVEYVMYIQATSVVGSELTAQVHFTTLSAGLKPATLAAEYPKAKRTFSDAQVLELFALRSCEMQYLVVPQADLASVDYAKAIVLDGGLKALETRKLQLLDLAPATPYVLCYATYYASDRPVLWKTFHFTTASSVPFKPSINLKEETQQLEGFGPSGKSYTISRETAGIGSQVSSWRMSGEEATVTVGTNATGETLPGLIVATTGEVTLAYRSALAADAKTLTLPNTNGQARFYAFPDKEKIHTVKFTKAANTEAELIAFGLSPVPLMLEQQGVPVIPLNGGAVHLSAKILWGGVWPMSFVWKSNGTKLGEGLSITTTALREPGMVQLVCTDAKGDETMLEVEVAQERPSILVGGFEEDIFNKRLANSGGQWRGNGNGATSYYATGSFTLPLNSNQNYYSGFVVSNDPSTEWDGNYLYDARCAAGHGANGTKNFGVAYLSELNLETATITLQTGTSGEAVPGVYLTNTAWTLSSVLHGPGGTGTLTPFKNGDSYTVTITADNGKKVTAYLADYTSQDPTQHFALSDWAWVDLSSLGKVKTLSFSVKAKCDDPVNFPTYFALDELGATRPERIEHRTVSANSLEVDLLELTNLNKTMPLQTTVTVEGSALVSAVNGVTLSLSGAKLQISGWDAATGQAAEETFTFKLSQLGRTEWVQLTLHYSNNSPKPKIVLAGINFDEAMGTLSVENEASHTALKVGDELQLDQVIIITAEPKKGYKLSEGKDALTVSHAERIGVSNRWRVLGTGDVSVSAVFVKDNSSPQPTYVQLIAVKYDATMGKVEVKDKTGQPIQPTAKIEVGTSIQVIASPLQGFRLGDPAIQVTNAKRSSTSESMWQVTGEGDVTVTVNFERVLAVEPLWAASLSLAPNPCREWLRVDGVADEMLRYEVYDASGRRIAEGTVMPESSTVNTARMPSGIYLLRLYNGQGESTARRFAKQ